MRKIFFIILIAIFITDVSSQTCLPEGIVFGRQVQIDIFKENYPNCKKILGDVTIEDGDWLPDIITLEGLNEITSIEGALCIKNCPLLSELNGLESLLSVGGDLWISDNNLYNLVGLNNLSAVGGRLSFWSNDQLRNLNALMDLDTVGSDLLIQNNPWLENLNGLNNLKYIGRDFEINEDYIVSLEALANLNTIVGNLQINSCSYLSNLDGLENLSSIGNTISITSNYSLSNLGGLKNITNVGGDFELYGNANLSSLTGLENLVSIGGILSLGDIGFDGTSGNPLLENFAELENLTTIGGELKIIGNTALTKLTGLEHITPSSITGLAIINNPNLSYCEIESVCGYLANANPYDVYIVDNAEGCKDTTEIKEACKAISVPEYSSRIDFTIYPNPTTDILIIKSNYDLTIEKVCIYNQFGQVVFTRNERTEKIDVSILSKGVYIIELISKEMKERQQLVIVE